MTILLHLHDAHIASFPFKRVNCVDLFLCWLQKQYIQVYISIYWIWLVCSMRWGHSLYHLRECTIFQLKNVLLITCYYITCHHACVFLMCAGRISAAFDLTFLGKQKKANYKCYRWSLSDCFYKEKLFFVKKYFLKLFLLLFQSRFYHCHYQSCELNYT